jgi:hypothetical protein
MKKITFLSMKIIICFLLLTSINSYGAEILDQTFALPGSATTINGTGSGQSFTAGYSGPLTKVVINIQDQAPTASSSDIRIRIIEGSGSCGSNILADQTFLNIAEFQNYEFIFTSSPTLVLGQIYTIHISTTDGSLCNIAFGSGGYSNGDFFSGISCTPFGGGTDFWFETYMSVCNITDQTVNASQSNLCENGSVTISTGGSEAGYKYYLRDNVDNSIVAGPTEGTGASLGLNTGTINTTTTYNVYAKEIMISAVDLSNNNDKIRFNTPFSSYTNEITVEAWVNFTSTSFANFPWATQSSTNDVDNMAENVWLWTPGGVGTFYVNDNGAWKTINFPAMTSTGWHHIATVANPSGMYIYYDGVLVASNTNGITSTIINNPASVIELGQDGRYPNLVTRNSSNAFDDFRVWSVARTPIEIANNYQNCLIGNETGLVQYTRMNEGSGTTVSSLQGVSGAILNGITNPWVLGSGTCDGGCALQMTQLATITVSNSLTSSVSSQTNVSCNGGSNGSATISAGGGTAPYTYSWSPTGGTDATATGLSPNAYTVTITDASGCTHLQPLVITHPTAITSSVSSQTNVSCNGGSNGSATISAAGGSAPYTYSWSPTGGTDATATGLTANAYTVNITDASGCTHLQPLVITHPTAITSSVSSQTNVSCNGGANGSATISAAGGSAPYTYSWSPTGGTDATATGLTANAYTVTIIDAQGCTHLQPLVITHPTAITSSVSSQTNVSCNGGANGSATISAAGGSAPYTYSWSPTGGTDATASGLTANAYTVNITDASGCTHLQPLVITHPTEIISSQTFTECVGFSVTVGTNTYNTTGVYNDVFTNAAGCDSTVTTNLTITMIDNATTVANETITADLTGAIYQWVDCDNGNAPIAGATGQSFTAIVNGNYAVEITENGCTEMSNCVAIMSVGILENNGLSSIIIFPNPSTGMFTVSTNQLGKNYIITDNIGKVVMQGILNTTQMDIDISNNAKGIYLLTIEGHVFKLVKQ